MILVFSFGVGFENRANSIILGDVSPDVGLEDLEQIDPLDIDDPLENLNRGLYQFNLLLDTAIVRPIALTYRYLIPPFMQTGVANVTSNLAEPLSFVNHTLQLKGDQAITSFLRFLINSTIGVFGLFDPATDMGIDQHKEDLGQTFAGIGVKPGPYLVLPLLGPSNLRDTLGLIGDFFIDPFNIIARNNDRKDLTYVRTGVEKLVQREALLDLTDDIEKASDPYTRAKLLYMQHRAFLVRDGVPLEDLEGPVPWEEDEVKGEENEEEDFKK
ncbi:MAG: VacJ family lipoprotein [bacterium]|nr:VacJ family lipoprotein [bacterium]